MNSTRYAAQGCSATSLHSISRAALLALPLALAACGGGGGGAAPTPTAADETDAGEAHVSAKLVLASKTLSLTWVDTFPTASGYQIEEQDGSSWKTLDTIPGQAGTGRTLTWNGAVTASGTFRVEAVMSGYTVPLDTPSSRTSLSVTVPATAPAIVLNEAEPLTDTVLVSIGNGSGYTSARFYFDSSNGGFNDDAPAFATTWDVSGLTAGAHLVRIDLTSAPDSFVEITRPVQVANPGINLTIGFTCCTSPKSLEVEASSDYGIATASAQIDGLSLGTLTAPNLDGNSFAFAIPPAQSLSGTHILTAQVTDHDGKSAATTVVALFNDPPALSVSAPFDGMLAYGSLHLAGTFSSDKAGVVTLTAELGTKQIFSTTTSPFAADYSLSGVAPGNYTLTLSAKDSDNVTTLTRTVTVTSSAALAYSPVSNIGAGGQVLAADANPVMVGSSGSTTAYDVLYQLQDGSVHLLAGSGGSATTTDTTLQTAGTALQAPSSSPTQWQLGGGHVLALGTGVNPPNVDVYVWAQGTAAPQDLGTLGPPGELARIRAVHWPWVLASDGTPNNQASGFTPLLEFYNASNAETITPSLTSASLLGTGDDFYLGSTGLVLYYAQDSSASAGIEPIGIAEWDQSTGQSTTVAAGNFWQINQQTDGTRLVWQSGAPGATGAVGASQYSLDVLDIGSSALSTLSTTLDPSPDAPPSLPLANFQLGGGVLAWQESSATAAAIKVTDFTTTTTLSNQFSSRLYGNGGGYVLYSQNSKLYVWSAAHGSRLFLDVVPGVVFVANGYAVFTNGASQALYVVALN